MNRLRELRGKKRLTQQDMGNFLGISQNAYSYWENDKVKIDNVSLEKLSDFFDESTDYILGREEKIKPPVYDEETLAFLDELKSRPELKLLFNVSKNATKADIEVAIKILEAFKERESK